MKPILIAAALAATAALSTAPLQGGPVNEQLRVRTHDDVHVIRSAPLDVLQPFGVRAAPLICDFSTLARHGEAAPHGGTFSLSAFSNPANLNNAGAIAFYSRVDGDDQNQGVFTAAVGGAEKIVVGCGPGGGSADPPGTCGDPSPVGGTFSGFFSGTFFAPDHNDNGDVLFFADIAEGDSPRGLFLRDGDTGDYRVVAAVGDPSPLGGVFSAVGPGSLNNHGDVVFIARTGAQQNPNIFLWQDGAVSKVVAIGDPAPGGGVFSLLSSESLGFADGTSVPVGPLPDINDAGQIAFRGNVSAGGLANQGLFVMTGGVIEWYVQNGSDAPEGGTFAGFQGPILSETGQIAFFSDVNLGGGQFTSAWFAGEPGSLRRVMAFNDAVGEGVVSSMAFSRNPMQPIDPTGNVLVWVRLRFPDNSEPDALLLSRPSGALDVVVLEGDPAPHGGTVGNMDAWPSMNDRRQGAVSAATPGGALSAHMVFSLCAPGDLNGDGCVDQADLGELLGDWGCTGGDCVGDIDGDGDTDQADLGELLAHYGDGC